MKLRLRGDAEFERLRHGKFTMESDRARGFIIRAFVGLIEHTNEVTSTLTTLCNNRKLGSTAGAPSRALVEHLIERASVKIGDLAWIAWYDQECLSTLNQLASLTYAPAPYPSLLH